MPDEPLLSASSSAFSIASLVQLYLCVASSNKAGVKKDNWIKPPADCVKVNVDAGFSEEELRGSVDCGGGDQEPC